MFRLLSLCLLSSLLPGAAPTGGHDASRVRVVAQKARLNRRVLGDVVDWVDSVPAAPVDSMVWNGKGSTPLTKADFFLQVDPVRNAGVIRARWTDENGRWDVVVTTFTHPHHPGGARIGASVEQVDYILKDAVVQNAYLHGDTAAGPPVLPTVFTYLAAWGYASVQLDGKPFLNPYDGPAPQWEAHVMVTEGVRGKDGTVRTLDGDIYDPSHQSEGRVDPSDVEVHLTFHDARYPTVPGNMPPDFHFFYHLLFEDASLELVQVDLDED